MLLLAAVCQAQEISPLLVPVDRGTPPGIDVKFWLVYLNTTPTPATVHVPAKLPITLGPLPYKLHQSLIRQENVSVITIPPGGFRRVLFSTPMPANVTGPVTFELNQSGSPAPVEVVAAAPPASHETPPTVATGAPPAPHVQSAASSQPYTATTSEPLTLKQSHWDDDSFTETFAHHLSTYQPMYFIAGTRPTAKFQISLKYQIFDEDGSWAQKYSFLDHIYLAYTQTSFWDVASSNPRFTDNSYKPELMFSYDNILRDDSTFLHLATLGLQGGFLHESNGTGGLMERSMNIVYLRPIFTWDIDKPNSWFISVAPRAYVYVTTGDYDHDMSLYRGYGDIRLVVGQRYGPQLAIFARVGEDFNRGALEIDFSQPLRGHSRGNLDLYFYAQFFTGFGEQLTYYNKSSTTIRVGIAFVR